MLELLGALLVLAIIGWIGWAVLVGLGAPPWLIHVGAGVLLIVALVVIARWAQVSLPQPNVVARRS